MQFPEDTTQSVFSSYQSFRYLFFSTWVGRLRNKSTSLQKGGSQIAINECGRLYGLVQHQPDLTTFMDKCMRPDLTYPLSDEP
jgi:hypothetical protein